jgi:hypothetical protein
MANFAIIENDKVINVIVADSIEIAQQVTDREVTETNGEPWIDWKRVDGVWVNPVQEIIDVEEVTPTPALEG